MRPSAPLSKWELKGASSCLIYLTLAFDAGKFSVYLHCEGHLQDILWAKLALFTNGSTGKGEVRRSGTLGDEAPDAHALVLQGIAGRRLQVQRALRHAG